MEMAMEVMESMKAMVMAAELRGDGDLTCGGCFWVFFSLGVAASL